MATNQSEPSTSNSSVTEVVWTHHAFSNNEASLQAYNTVNGVASSNDYQDSPVPSTENAPSHYEHRIDDNNPDEAQCDSYRMHLSSRGHSPENVITSSPSTSETNSLSLQAEASNLQQTSVSQESALGHVPLTVNSHLTLQHAANLSQQNSSNLGLPLILDRGSLTAFVNNSRPDTTLSLENLHRPVISSQSLSHRSVLTNDQSQFLTADISVAAITHNLLPPSLTQREMLPTMISSTSSMSHNIGSSFPINHKQMLAQKYAAELEAPSTSSSVSSNLRSHVIENMNERPASPYVVSSANTLIDTQGISVYTSHQSLSTSVSSSLPIDVYSMDRGIALVSSTRESPDDIIEGVHRFSGVQSISQPLVHGFVSSSVDLVPANHVEPGMHCVVDSTVGPKLHQHDEPVVDSSDNYGQHVDTSTDGGLHTTTQGYSQHINDLSSCNEATASSTVSSVLNGADALDSRSVLNNAANHLLAANGAFLAARNGASTDDVDDVNACSAVSSATHPDSTRNSLELSVHSPITAGLNALSSLVPESHQSLDQHSRPRRDLRTNRHWCEDCNQYYEKDCPHHRIQLIFDKPVLSRAWASLPATYLYVNKIFLKENGEPIYGVFAKKTIPKRTQFGPIEGVLVKKEDHSKDKFVLLTEQQDHTVAYLDTTDESLSNWMRFVRPADHYREQNLVLVQQGQSLYFNTTKAINPKTELRVWYSGTYAEKWGLRVLEPNDEERKALEEEEKAWPCFECNKRFSNSEELQKHLNFHDEENGTIEEGPGSRTRGRTKGRTRAQKKTRTRSKVKDPDDTTTKQDEFQCEICHKVFPRNYSLQRHLIMHSGEKKYKCPICDMKFSHVYNRNRHVRRHRQRGETEPVIKPFKSLFRRKQGAEWICTHCDLTFDNSSLLNLHTLTHAAEDVGLSDPSMGDTYNEHTIIMDGFQSVGNEEKCKCLEETFLKCPECTQEFSCKKQLIEHASSHGKILTKHRTFRGMINPLKPFKCNLCYKSFASDERLIRHYLVHGSEDSKPLQCDTCYKRFLNNSALACHIKIHSEEKKYYECPICKRAFDQIVTLKEHVRVHYENGGYTCPHCQKTFQEYNQIRKHIRAFHSERRYPCEKCDKIFPRPDKLKLHMLRHSDHREFLCANCGKQFKRKDKLKEHMKRMHAPEREARLTARGSKPSSSKKFVPKVSPTDYHRFIYKCHTCLLGFKRRGMLVNHLAKRHPDIRPESVPELNLPILKTTRDYYCQYCEKVYKSSSKRKAHILKNHPGAELPMSNRRKGGIPEIPGIPNPTFSQTVGSITTHPHHCDWCHKQYASKAKLLQHQRKKHIDMLALSYVSSKAPTQVQTVSTQQNATTVAGHIVIAQGLTNTLPADGTVIDAIKRKIQYVDRDVATLITSQQDVLPTADLLTQAMSELTQTLNEYRPSPGEYLTNRISHSTPPTMVSGSPNSTPVPTPQPTPVPTPTPTHTPGPTSQDNSPQTTLTASIDQNQLNQLLAQYQQAPLSPPTMTAVTTAAYPTRSWPSTVTNTLNNYPAR